METEIIRKVKEFVENECRKPTSKYGYDPFVFHFGSVVSIAKNIAKKLGADIEVVEISGWLHDIGSIIYGRKDHHLTGAKIAEEKLKEFNYPVEKIKEVVHCILSHRGSQDIKAETIEAKIIAEADAIDSFNRFPGLFEAAYVFEKLSREKARESVRNKLKNKWSQLNLKESKEFVRPKYEAAMLLLK